MAWSSRLKSYHQLTYEMGACRDGYGDLDFLYPEQPEMLLH